MDSSDEEIGSSDSASDSLAKILNRDTKTSFEIAPEFKILPRDVTADAPSSIKITCTLMASPEPEIIWTKNDTVELNSGDRYRIIHKGHLCMLEILRSHPSDSGTYTVSATNSLGSASCCVKVTVRGLCTLFNSLSRVILYCSLTGCFHFPTCTQKSVSFGILEQSPLRTSSSLCGGEQSGCFYKSLSLALLRIGKVKSARRLK